jgi:hypothetical protein
MCSSCPMLLTTLPLASTQLYIFQVPTVFIHSTKYSKRNKVQNFKVRNSYIQGYQNRDFTSSRKGVAKSGLVKSQSKSKDFTQGLL